MLRIGFVTCVQLGLGCMQAIHAAGGRLQAAFSLLDEQAADKSGRVYLDRFCGEHAVPLVKFRNINGPESVQAIRRADLDWLFIVGWSQIAQAEVLAATRLGALGMHPTLLPEGRGRAAIPWAILKGLTRTGVTLFKLDSGVDTGPILAQQVVPIRAGETATTLYQRIESAHRDLIVASWETLAGGTLQLQPQDESLATYWPGRRPEDGRLTTADPLAYADTLVRAVTRPYPGAFIDLPWGRITIWAAAMEPGQAAPMPASEGELRAVPCLPFVGGRLRLTDFAVG